MGSASPVQNYTGPEFAHYLKQLATETDETRRKPLLTPLGEEIEEQKEVRNLETLAILSPTAQPRWWVHRVPGLLTVCDDRRRSAVYVEVVSAAVH